MTNDSKISRAAKHIDATELGDGRWAHYADEASTWYVVTADELAELCDYLDDEDEQISGDAYSHWCAGTSAQEMPKGWKPEYGTRDDRTYGIDDGDGNSITQGVSAHEIERVAQDIADERGEPVWYYRSPACDGEESTQVDPA